MHYLVGDSQFCKVWTHFTITGTNVDRMGPTMTHLVMKGVIQPHAQNRHQNSAVWTIQFEPHTQNRHQNSAV